MKKLRWANERKAKASNAAGKPYTSKVIKPYTYSKGFITDPFIEEGLNTLSSTTTAELSRHTR